MTQEVVKARQPRTYNASFWIKNDDKGWERLGAIEIDDRGVSADLTLCAKAFRHAPPQCGIAQKIRFEQIR